MRGRDRAVIEKRIGRIEGFLLQNHPECFVEQKHLDAESKERAYWHYGYLCALRDIVKLLLAVTDQPKALQRGQG